MLSWTRVAGQVGRTAWAQRPAVLGMFKDQKRNPALGEGFGRRSWERLECLDLVVWVGALGRCGTHSVTISSSEAKGFCLPGRRLRTASCPPTM